MANTLLVLTRDQDIYFETLKKRNLPDLKIVAPKNDAEIKEILPLANIILGDPPQSFKFINEARNLKWMQSTFVGVDLLMQEGLRRDYALTNVKEIYGGVIAEYLLAYILSFEKKIQENIQWQRERRWNQIEYRSLDEKTFGIFGTGSIGRHVASLLKAFGSRVLGFHTSLKSVEPFDKTFCGPGISEFLKASDYVISILPNTPKTKHLINREVFSQMKPSAIFMSVGRGSNVCEGDLIEAITGNVIRGAVLDVFETEPLPAESPLWTLPNTYITPHVSGYYVCDKIFDIFSANYLRFLRGDELMYRIDFNAGY